MHHGHTQSPIGTFTNGTVGQPICHLVEQWSQTNMVDARHDSPHNMHCKRFKIVSNNVFTLPCTCDRWYNEQFYTWSFHIWPFQPSNYTTPKGKTFFTCKMAQLAFCFLVVILFVGVNCLVMGLMVVTIIQDHMCSCPLFVVIANKNKNEIALSCSEKLSSAP